MLNKTFIICLSIMILSSCSNHDSFELKSPNNKISFKLENSKTLMPNFNLTYENNLLINNSLLGFVSQSGDTLLKNAEISDIILSEKDEIWEPIYGEQNHYRDNYKEAFIIFNSKNYDNVGLRVRAYNEGVAFRYEFLNDKRIELKDELTEFSFSSNANVWVTTGAQCEIYKRKIKELEKGTYDRPILLESSPSLFLAIGEAGLIDFARMRFTPKQKGGNILKASLDKNIKKLPTVELEGEDKKSPWRFIMVGHSASEILQNNFLVLNLNDPCKMKDVSWIKPGKVLREMSLSTKGAKASIDFCKRNNFQYIMFDGGWYGDPSNEKSDALTVTPNIKKSAGPLEMEKVIEYGKSNNVGVILYADRQEIEKKDEKMFELYHSWGVQGFKYGFVQTGSQYWTKWLHRSIMNAAKNKLMINIHDNYRPTGLTRTYPFMMTVEGIRGDEESANNETVLKTLFTRMIVGGGDQTNCYYSSRVENKMGSRVSQMAKVVCLYSPWQHLFWYERPTGSPVKPGESATFIKEKEEIKFFAKVPTVWDKSIIINGYPGEYATIARCKDDCWFVGGLTGSKEHKFKIDLNFLDSNTEYEATIYTDDWSDLENKKVVIEKKLVTNKSCFEKSIDRMKGLAMIISPK